MRRLLPAACLCLLLGPSAARGQSTELWRSWNQPIEPFHVVDNIHYVGANDIASYLITTADGHILLDGGFPETAAIIRDGVTKLGFRLQDVKILLNSHAHFDHAGGLAELAAATGARVVISERDAGTVESGGRTDFLMGDLEAAHFPPVKVDRRIGDREQVRLGGVTMTAHVTAGHTPGCTSWAMQVQGEQGPLDVVFVCSTSVLADYRLLEKPSYEGIREDFEATFARLKSLPCDIFLAPHTRFFEMDEKLKGRKPGDRNPFIDPAAYRAYVADGERRFLKHLAREAESD